MAISKKVTIQQIADEAGVSIATVSRILNRSSNVNPDTRKRVLDAMKVLEFQSKTIGGFLPQNNSILVCCPELSNPFIADVINGIQDVAFQHDYHIFCFQSKNYYNSIQDYEHFLKHNRFSGLILVHNLASPELLEDLSIRYPIVMCSEHCSDDSISYVGINDYSAGYGATQHLIKTGRKKIGLINSQLQNNYAKHRERGFRSALEEAGLPVNENWMVHLPEVSFDTALPYITGILSMTDHPDALFCVSDTFAAAVITAATNIGLRVPEDIAVIGFDNTTLSTMVVPPLTTVSQPSYRMGQHACELLLERIENPSTPTRRIILGTDLIVRGST